MTTQKLDRKRALAWRVGLTLVLVVAAFYLLAAHWQVVSVSLNTALHAHVEWLLFSLLLMVASFCIAAFTYQVLALRRLRYSQTLLIEVAGSFVGRLLPAGLGGLGLNGVYLYKKKHTPAEATAVISVNNLLGMCAHVLLLLALSMYRPNIVMKLVEHYHLQVSWLWILVAVAALLPCYIVPIIRIKVMRFGRNLLVSVRKEKPEKIVLAVLSSALLTITYTMLLYSTSHAIGIGIGLLGTFVIFSLGMFIGTATPTPGGLIGAEAGLFSGFVSYGVPGTTAGAAVLLFRLMTYWLPLLPGALALLVARKQKLL